MLGMPVSEEEIMGQQINDTRSRGTKAENPAISRRKLLKTLGGGAASVGAGVVLIGQPAFVEAAGTKTGPGAFSSDTATAAVSGISTGANGTGVNGSGATGVRGSSSSSNGYGVRGVNLADSGSAIGVTGVSFSEDGTGVQGLVSAPSGNGVLGRNTDESGAGTGVKGYSYSPKGYAVRGANLGDSGSAIGVAGVSFSETGIAVQGAVSAPDGYGVVGLNSATYGSGAVGVGGQSSSPDGCGVEGLNFATSGSDAVGVFGQSASADGSGVEGLDTSTSGSAHGVYGESRSPDGHGVSGANLATSGYAVGVQGGTSSPEGYAVAGVNDATSGRSVGVYGQTGNSDGGIGVLCKGKLATTGVVVSGFPFLGATLSLYSVASPECWLEDFGSAELVHGTAHVSLDSAFAAAIHTDGYSVFVVPEGDCRGLYVTAKTPAGFTVRELLGGRATVPFSYRVVARRQDVDAPRLAEVDLSPLAFSARDRAPRNARNSLLA